MAAAGEGNPAQDGRSAAPVSLPSIALGADPNSVAVRNGVIAVAVNSAVSRQARGEVRFFNAGGTPTPVSSQTVET